MPTGKQLRKLIELRCAEMGISMIELSKLAGRSQSWAYDICQSDKVQIKTIHHLAKTLKVDVSYFFADEDRNHSDTDGGKK